MKKITRSFFAALLGLIALVGLSGCEQENTVQNAYSFGLSSFNKGRLEDINSVNSYLESKGCPLKPQIFTGTSLKDTDAQAAQAFKRYAAKLSYAEIDALGLWKGTTFTYSCSRYVDPDNSESGVLILGSFVYPEGYVEPEYPGDEELGEH